MAVLDPQDVRNTQFLLPGSWNQRGPGSPACRCHSRWRSRRSADEQRCSRAPRCRQRVPPQADPEGRSGSQPDPRECRPPTPNTWALGWMKTGQMGRRPKIASADPHAYPATWPPGRRTGSAASRTGRPCQQAVGETLGREPQAGRRRVMWIWGLRIRHAAGCRAVEVSPAPDMTFC
jgi:hypothetical protein